MKKLIIKAISPVAITIGLFYLMLKLDTAHIDFALFTVFSVLLSLIIIYRVWRQDIYDRQAKAEVRRQFHWIKSQAIRDHSLAFDPDSIEILVDKCQAAVPEWGRMSWFLATPTVGVHEVLCKNDRGEYLYYTSGPPNSIKRLTRKQAKGLLISHPRKYRKEFGNEPYHSEAPGP